MTLSFDAAPAAAMAGQPRLLLPLQATGCTKGLEARSQATAASLGTAVQGTGRAFALLPLPRAA